MHLTSDNIKTKISYLLHKAEVSPPNIMLYSALLQIFPSGSCMCLVLVCVLYSYPTLFCCHNYLTSTVEWNNASGKCIDKTVLRERKTRHDSLRSPALVILVLLFVFFK